MAIVDTWDVAGALKYRKSEEPDVPED